MIARNNKKQLITPYLSLAVKDFFYNMTWEELNKPFQKHHVVNAFEEFKNFKFKKHINLQLGAGVDKLFEKLIDDKESLDGNFSEQGQQEILDYHNKLVKQVKRLNQFFSKFDRSKAEKIVQKGQKYKDVEEKYRLEHFQRVSGDIAESVATHELHMELMDMLKQMNIFIELIASTLLKLELENN